MSLLRASLRLLPLLALAAACTGKRGDPEPSQNPPPISGGGNGTGGTGGAPSNGGNGTGGTGGAPSNGGMGGTPSTGGMGGMGGMAGVGGGTFNDVSEMYPYCGCLDDSKELGACGDCYTAAATDAACSPVGACDAGCQAIINFITTNSACTFVDEACLQAAFAQAPAEWDDAIDKIKCKCELCPAPFGCEAVACPGG